MRPNVLIIGGGGGSWEVRGKQLGAAIGARVTSTPSRADWAKAHLVILVKRALEEFGPECIRHRVPFIWDAVDFWRQPEDNQTSEANAPALAQAYLAGMTPVLTVCATQAMADDLGGVYLPHHNWPRLSAKPIRETLSIVAYQGTPKYLGTWRPVLEVACARIGAKFVVNPDDMGQADLLVAFRGERWDGPICRRWKSGVKYVNAMAAGRPILSQPSAAFSEINPPGEALNDITEVADAVAAWSDPGRRAAALERCKRRSDEFALHAVARRYRQVIESAFERAAA